MGFVVVTEHRGPEDGGLHARLLDDLGPALADGQPAAGTVVRIEDLQARFHLSRTVVREAVRVLEALGMVTSRRRVGLTVQPMQRWNVYDPKLIRWRLAGTGRADQLRSLTELRAAVEPAAAAGAAENIDPDSAAELVRTAELMVRTGQAGDLVAFLALDIAFHRILLTRSGNEMFAALDEVVAAVLAGRTEHQLMPAHPEPRALRLHTAVAHAVRSGDATGAADAMRELTAEVRTGLELGP
jgi:DNA-binding FadR family transcriptional regulator